MAAGGNENRVIFDTSLAKTQHGCGEWPSPAICDFAGDALARNEFYSIVTARRPISLSNLVQLVGIVIRDGLRQPNQAFVVAQRGYVPRNDRRRRPFEIDQDVWH